MRSSLRRPALLSVVALSFALVACGAGGTATATATMTATLKATATVAPSPTATPKPSARVVQVSKTQHFADSKSGGTSAPCANGEPLIAGNCGVTVTATCANVDVVVAGGFAVDDSLAHVTASYPSSTTAWTVTAHDEGRDGGSHPVTVTAYAECLHANFRAGVAPISSKLSIPLDGVGHEMHLPCAAGTVLTGGGFRGSSSQEMIPIANGWNVTFGVTPDSSATPQIVVVCAAKHLAAAEWVKGVMEFQVGSVANVGFGCADGALLTAGGVDTVPYGNITTFKANNSVTQWTGTVSPVGAVGGSPGTHGVSFTSICVTVH